MSIEYYGFALDRVLCHFFTKETILTFESFIRETNITSRSGFTLWARAVTLPGGWGVGGGV